VQQTEQLQRRVGCTTVKLIDQISDPVDKILSAYGLSRPWQPLAATGVANRVYATQDVILRIATDHFEANADALTESVAAPIARGAGVLTPRLIAFDNSKILTNRPFSLWERVHGDTLGLSSLPATIRADIWREIGQEIARLHDRVKSCPDPMGYLDQPRRELRLDLVIGQFADSPHANRGTIHEIEALVSDLSTFVAWDGSPSFLHSDLHEWNVMWGRQGGLLALIDWGDAGWGDPALDFAAVPLDSLCAALEGYGGKKRLGAYPEARLIWDHLQIALEEAIDNPQLTIPIADFRRLIDTARL
jgi:aminoglycoside phosphotransferase (APT) family kinase protein